MLQATPLHPLHDLMGPQGAVAEAYHPRVALPPPHMQLVDLAGDDDDIRALHMQNARNKQPVRCRQIPSVAAEGSTLVDSTRGRFHCVRGLSGFEYDGEDNHDHDHDAANINNSTTTEGDHGDEAGRDDGDGGNDGNDAVVETSGPLDGNDSDRTEVSLVADDDQLKRRHDSLFDDPFQDEAVQTANVVDVGTDFLDQPDFTLSYTDFSALSGTNPLTRPLTPPLPPVTTAEACRERVLTIFPDVNHQYVEKLWNEFSVESDAPAIFAPARFENVLEKLLAEPNYPKQPKGKDVQLKRKRSPSPASLDHKQSLHFYLAKQRRPCPPPYRRVIVEILKEDFPDFTIMFLAEKLHLNQNLLPAYVAIAAADMASNPLILSICSVPAWIRVVKQTSSRRMPHACNRETSLHAELRAARQYVCDIYGQQAADEEKRFAEAENTRIAIASGQMAECQVCFDDLPTNRQVHCGGSEPHYTCFDCALNYVRCQVGDARCDVKCTAGCGAGFAPAQLNLLADKPLLEKLARLQQDQDIREAALDDLEECPFCEFKAIMTASVEEDFEFRCLNPECEKVSCRRCRAISHVPLSCAEFVKDKKLSGRHQVEEAMTAALVRACNKCKKQFIKDHGCNKMTCPSCSHRQCYICSASLSNDYDHFDRNDTITAAQTDPKTTVKRKCPLFDNVEERHEREVQQAAAQARKAVLQEHPDVAEQDLDIKFADSTTPQAIRTHHRAARRGRGRGAQLHNQHVAWRDEILDVPQPFRPHLDLPRALVAEVNLIRRGRENDQSHQREILDPGRRRAPSGRPPQELVGLGVPLLGRLNGVIPAQGHGPANALPLPQVPPDLLFSPTTYARHASQSQNGTEQAQTHAPHSRLGLRQSGLLGANEMHGSSQVPIHTTSNRHDASPVEQGPSNASRGLPDFDPESSIIPVALQNRMSNVNPVAPFAPSPLTAFPPAARNDELKFPDQENLVPFLPSGPIDAHDLDFNHLHTKPNAAASVGDDIPLNMLWAAQNLSDEHSPQMGQDPLTFNVPLDLPDPSQPASGFFPDLYNWTDNHFFGLPPAYLLPAVPSLPTSTPPHTQPTAAHGPNRDYWSSAAYDPDTGLAPHTCVPMPHNLPVTEYFETPLPAPGPSSAPSMYPDDTSSIGAGTDLETAFPWFGRVDYNKN